MARERSHFRVALLLAGGLLAAGAAVLARGFQITGRPPANAPAAFLRRGRQPGTGTLVVCAGDSITHGRVSASYVAPLGRRLGGQGYEFVNAGVNGQLAYNLLQRLDQIIACRPDVITLLIGTNDVLATAGALRAAQYAWEQRLPRRADRAWFRQNLARILDRLESELDARILLLSLPPLGEDLSAELNQRVLRYNAVIRELARERGLTYLPLYEALAEELTRAGHQPRRPFRGQMLPMYKAIWLRYGRRKTWSEIAARNGLLLLTDHIHLSERGAAVLADLLAGALERAAPVSSNRSASNV